MNPFANNFLSVMDYNYGYSYNFAIYIYNLYIYTYTFANNFVGGDPPSDSSPRPYRKTQRGALCFDPRDLGTQPQRLIQATTTLLKMAGWTKINHNA